MSLIRAQQISGSVASATIATKIQSGSIIASIATVGGGVLNIDSGSTNLVYVSGSTGNMGVKGNVSASGLYAANIGAGTGTTVSAQTLSTQTATVTTLLSIEVLTSLKQFIEFDAGSEDLLIEYSPTDYYGIVIDAVAYAPSSDDALTFRTTLSNTQTKVGQIDTAVLSSTNPYFGQKFAETVTMEAQWVSPIQLQIRLSNRYPYPINVRPTYRLVKQALTG